MLFDIQAIMALRPNGTPLYITVDNAGALRCSLSAAGRGTFELSSSILIPDPVETIHQAFSHYPDEVTINGEEVKRDPVPGTTPPYGSPKHRTWTGPPPPSNPLASTEHLPSRRD